MKSFYITKVFFPWMNQALKSSRIGGLRQQLLSQVNGVTLEIGFGTGLNLPYYPKNISNLIAIDTYHGEVQIIGGEPSFEFQIMDAQKLTFSDVSFDTVVSTFTLCSVKNLSDVVSEIHRVLKPNGKFLFLEHGKSWRKGFSVLQDIANPFFLLFAAGCNVNREIEKELRSGGFSLGKVEHIRFRSHFISGFYYFGIATKNV